MPPTDTETASDQSRLLTAFEYAALHQHHPATIWRWCREDRLASVRLGRAVMIPANARPEPAKTKK